MEILPRGDTCRSRFIGHATLYSDWLPFSLSLSLSLSLSRSLLLYGNAFRGTDRFECFTIFLFPFSFFFLQRLVVDFFYFSVVGGVMKKQKKEKKTKETRQVNHLGSTTVAANLDCCSLVWSVRCEN